jgi:hypothetical protein
MRKPSLTPLLTFVIFMTTLVALGQTTNNFYTTLDDYYQNKPIEGFTIAENSWSMSMGSESYDLTNGSCTQKTKLEKLPSDLYTYRGYLMRTYEGHSYRVLALGALCFYYMQNPDYHGDFYSETISGEIKKLKRKTFEGYLSKYNLSEDFKSDKKKREFKDTNLIARYFRIINEKIK